MSNPFDKETLSQREKDILQNGGWQCSFCATVNADYITTCACSHNRDDSYENLHGRYVPREDEEWTEAGITVEGPAQTVAEPEPASQPAAPVVESEPAFQSASSTTTAFEPEPVAPSPVTTEPATPPVATEPSTPPVTQEPTAPAPKAPVSNTNRPMEEYSEYEQGILRDGGWECAFCSRINANYITTCACGHSTDDSYLKRRGKYVDPDGEDQEETASETTAQPASAASAAPQQETASAGKPTAEKSGDEMIAEIEQELQKNDTPTARLRAIRKFKDLNKKGFMSAEELNRRMDELMGFDDEEESEDSEESTESETAENNDNTQEEEEFELL